MAVSASKTIVLIGASQFSDNKAPPTGALSPLDMLESVARQAALDAGSPDASQLLTQIDMLAVVRTFFDSLPGFKPSWINYDNLPKSLANRLGCTPPQLYYPHIGGNTPQWLVNLAAEKIAAGEVKLALLGGAEAMRTMAAAQRAGLTLDWQDETHSRPVEIGDPRPGMSDCEMRHGLGLPTHAYPLFETALAHHYGRTQQHHQKVVGDLLRRFADVAGQNPLAQFPTSRSAEEIVTPDAQNRMIAWPYTKAMCAQMFVDQAAAVLMTSLEEARRLKIPEDKLVYLHGCADTTEKWLLSERVDFHSSPAIRIGARHALDMAGVSVADIGHFDLYSCFSCAVEIAADEIGLSHDDPRGLTLTGGLPFFGGPGNNYTMHGIAEMMARLRANPGDYGLVTGNGWFLTKHSFGIYSAQPPKTAFERVPPARYQGDIDAMPSPAFVEKAVGPAVVESFTIGHDKSGPAQAIVFARVQESGARALAVSNDAVLLSKLESAPQPIGMPITLSHDEKRTYAMLA